MKTSSLAFSGTSENKTPIQVKESFYKRSIHTTRKKVGERRSLLNKHYPVVAKLDMTKLSHTVGNEYKPQGNHKKNSKACLRNFNSIQDLPKCRNLKNKLFSSVVLTGSEKPNKKVLTHKIENPSHSHRNAPVDEYSESGNFVFSQESRDSNTERNNYFSKIDVTHSELTKQNESYSIEKSMHHGRNISRMSIPMRLGALQANDESIERQVRTSRLEVKDIEILHVENSTESRGDSGSDLKKYLTKTEVRPSHTKAQCIKSDSKKTLKHFKFSPGTEKPIFQKARKISLKDEFMLTKRKSISKCQSHNDFGAINFTLGLMDPRNSPMKKSEMRKNMQELKDLRSQNISLTKELEHSKEEVKDLSERMDLFTKDNEFLTMKLQRLQTKNAELERSLAITNEAENIKKILSNLSILFMNNKKELNISPYQMDLITKLFGDVGTDNLKDRIKTLENKLDTKTKELISLKNDFKSCMGSFLDEIQKMEGPRLLMSSVKHKLASHKVRYNPKILQECLTESTNESDYARIKLDILNKLEELNDELSPRDVNNTCKMPNGSRPQKETDNELEAFMIELEHLDNISPRNPNSKDENKDSRFENTYDNLLSKPSFLLDNSRSPKRKKMKSKRILDTDILQMLYTQSKCLEENMNAVYGASYSKF
ncbi:unnamed protein product [Moneuplotes crassus]|uniref:Uncharacterized protein n=1 Tax=Euplotes crassus TaxID=5936 RepID=A0AAD1Y6P0_EUPCR|nr:unnamed protein product [Moneuplotes crassus]